VKRLLALLVALLVAVPAHAVPTYSYVLDTQSARTSSHTGAATPISKNIKACAAWLVATKNGGSNPTLDVKVQYSPDLGTTWFDELAFVQVTTGTVNQMVHVDSTVTRQFDTVRSVATIGGTSPSFDFTVYWKCE
jgi:hypothetical protein